MSTKLLDLSMLKEHIDNAETRKVDKDFLEHVEVFLSDPKLELTQGRRRLLLLCQNFNHFTFEQAYHFINPEAFEKEFETFTLKKSGLQFFNYCRTFLAILPIIWTWYSLSTASGEYQQDLVVNSDDRSLSFLRLWQDGFHNSTWLTFSHATLINVFLLAALLLISFYILNLESTARRLTQSFSKDLHEITLNLLNIVKAAGITPITSDADIDKVVERFKGVIEKLFKDSQKVVEDAKQAMIDSNKDRKYYDEQVRQSIKQLESSSRHLETSLKNLNAKGEIVQITNALSQTGKHLENVAHTLQIAVNVLAEEPNYNFFKRLFRIFRKKDNSKHKSN